MTPSGRDGRLIGSVGVRLTVAFMVVGLGAIGLFAVLVTYAASRDVADLAREERDGIAVSMAEAAGVAFADARGWPGADLDTVFALGREASGDVSVFDAAGTLVGGVRIDGQASDVSTHAIVANERRVGTMRVAFTSAGLTTPARHLRDALGTTVAAGAGLAALLAVGVSAAAARRITRPLAAVTTTVRAVSAGDRTARVGQVGGPGELGELGEAFDRMADALDHEDSTRRALVADVAHELRTPLTILRGTLEGLADGIIEPSPAQMASLHDDVLRLGQVVDDLEMLASADAAGFSLQPRVLDLAAVARATVARLAAQFETAEIGLSVRTDQALVRADPLRVDQVVTNLLTNALKFTPAGGTVSVTVGCEGQDARLVVADNGIGIPNEEQVRMFDRFWRGSAAQAVAGSGIGLTVVAELVAVHGGDVRVDSASGDGTRMTVTLPRVMADSPSILHTHSIGTAPALDVLGRSKEDDDTPSQPRTPNADLPPG